MHEVINQIKKRYKINLECDGIKYEMWRVDDTEYAKLEKSNILPIKHEWDFYSQIDITQRYTKNNNLNLAELFTILEYFLGESSNSYDEYRGSFKFHNLLVIKRENGIFFYVLNILDHRGYMIFDLYKVLKNAKEKYEPFNSEFSQEEIKYFFNYFHGFLIGYFNQIKSIIPRQKFLKKVDSSLILYGYKDGNYFEDDYESQEIYKQQIQLFEETYGISMSETNISDVIESITDTTLLNSL
jgi:hypothetical protein